MSLRPRRRAVPVAAADARSVRVRPLLALSANQPADRPLVLVAHPTAPTAGLREWWEWWEWVRGNGQQGETPNLPPEDQDVEYVKVAFSPTFSRECTQEKEGEYEKCMRDKRDKEVCTNKLNNDVQECVNKKARNKAAGLTAADRKLVTDAVEKLTLKNARDAATPHDSRRSAQLLRRMETEAGIRHDQVNRPPRSPPRERPFSSSSGP